MQLSNILGKSEKTDVKSFFSLKTHLKQQTLTQSAVQIKKGKKKKTVNYQYGYILRSDSPPLATVELATIEPLRFKIPKSNDRLIVPV